MKESKDVPLTKAQRQALIVAVTSELERWPNERRNSALRNAIKRLKKVDRDSR